jgi:DNA-binding CsgD family transcriptional regulator
MYERDEVLGSIRHLLERAVRGKGGTVFVIAPAGLGKTSVLRAAMNLARSRFDVRTGTGDAVEATLPYGLIGQLFGDESRLALPAGPEVEDLPAPNRFYATLRTVREAAAERPLMLAVDDLHWSDPDSLSILHLLYRRAPTLPLAAVATARPWPDAARRGAEQLAAQELADVQWLTPLSENAARHLLQDRLGSLNAAAADVAVAACDGNPLLLELVTLEQAHGETRLAGLPGQPETIRRMLLARFANIEPIGQRYLRAASALGTRFRPAVAAAVADVPLEEAAQAVQDLFAADLLRSDDRGWVRFRHALIRQAIYEDLASPARDYFHERAFRHVLGVGADVAEAAEQAMAANLFADAQAIETLSDAGRDALRAGAVQAARRYLTAAVRLAGDRAPALLQLRQARALLATGSVHDAAGVLEQILTGPDVPTDIRLSAQLMLGRAAFHMGATERAGDLFQGVASAAGVDHPDRLKALLDHTLQSWARLGPRAALPVAVRARALATPDEPYHQACAEAAWALCAWLSGDPAALEAAQKAARWRLLPKISPPGTTLWGLDPAAVPGDIAVWAEQFALGERLFSEALRLGEERTETFLLFHGAFSSSDLYCRLGRLDEALAMGERACDVAELLMPVALPLARAAKGMALMEAGRLVEAAACEDPLVGPEWYLATGAQLRLSATLAYRQGRIETACSQFDILDRRIAEWGVADPAHIPYAADAIAAYLAAGRLDDAERVTDWLRACPLPSRWPTAIAVAGQARIAAHEGDLITAESGLAEAVDLLRPVPMPLAQGQVLTAYGAILARRNQPERARTVLSEAVQRAQACGASWHAEQALTELRRAGGRPGRIPPGQLSPQEKAVARLARAGRTNREISRELFLSVNTVETHLSHIYRKLGIGRRSDLSSVDLS